MPAQKQYLVGLADGTLRTVVGYSLRGAAKQFCIHYNIPSGSEFKIKERGEGGWVYFTRTKVGIRELAS